MKKFLIVLAMVITASLLMGAGCFTVNTPPIITTLALPDATVGTAYTATVKATDADGDALTFSVSGPTGMVISGAGVISGWTPTATGTESITVAVTDGTDLVSANFIITVSAVEPEPEPELKLVGITVDPKTMDLTVGEEETIDSVIATYEFKGYDVDVDFEDCLFLSSNVKVATVDEDGIVTAVKIGTANILVDYEGETDTIAVTVGEVELDHIIASPGTITLTKENRIDSITSVVAHYTDDDTEIISLADCTLTSDDEDVATVDEDGLVEAVGKGVATITVSYEEDETTETDTIVVTVVYLPMEMIVDLPPFVVLRYTRFEIEIVANDDEDEMVRFYFTLPVGDYELECLSSDDWPPLNPGEEIVIGSSGGQPLIDEEVILEGKFYAIGTYETTVEVWTVTENNVKVELLCEKDITIVVEPQ